MRFRQARTLAGKWWHIVLLLLAMGTQQRAFAQEWPSLDLSEWSREDKRFAVNLAGAAFITGWGIANWEYFQHSPHAGSEDWFGEGTKEGGADKWGHFYTTYALGHGLAYLYEHWGYGKREAAWHGAWSSFGLMGLMELGDSFSEYGFSYEDMVMNALGAYTGYLLKTRPELARKIDIRVELQPELDKTDVFTDYDNLKYLIALKLDGFERLNRGPLRYLELQLGYYARNYSHPDPERHERTLYIALGLNLSRILRDLSYPRAGRVFNYLQVPGTYVEHGNDLNH